MKTILHTFLLLLFMASARGQSFHIHCISIASNGDATITWDRNTLAAASFRSFRVMHAGSQAGPYVVVDSTLLFSDTSRTHVGANAGTGAAWYFIVATSNNGGPDLVSDTVRALQLSVLNPGSGFANLAWAAMHTPLSITASPFYVIYREYPAGVFTRIDSVNAATSPNPMRYSDLISICNDTVNYRIEVQDFSGCRSVSNVDGDLFRDQQPPSVSPLDSVSLDPNGNVAIGWSPNSSLDTRAYVVLQGVGNIWTPIDTVFGINNTFVQTTANASGGIVSFELIAVDSCGNPSAQSAPHSTIFLHGAFDRCARAVYLEWNQYSYWNRPVRYEIWRSDNGSARQLIGAVAGTTFNDTTILTGVNYCYEIIAHDVSTTFSSTSSKFCFTPTFSPLPAYCIIRAVSVIALNTISVKATVDPNASIRGFNLLRANSANGVYTQVRTVLTGGATTVNLIDIVPDAAGRVYYYKVQVIDSCGLLVKTSAVSHSIRLRGEAQPGATNELAWSDYGTWSSGVAAYEVYRSVNGVRESNPVNIVQPGESLEFLDLVLEDYFSDGTFCYVIAAVQAPGDTSGFQDTAYSNELCLVQEPIVFIPNAFHPGGGINDIFQPYPLFVPKTGYKFLVFDRWGQVIFSTEDPVKGWDGTIDGTCVQRGVYDYLLETKKSDGTMYRKTGSVTLIR